MEEAGEFITVFGAVPSSTSRDAVEIVRCLFENILNRAKPLGLFGRGGTGAGTLVFGLGGEGGCDLGGSSRLRSLSFELL